MSQWKYSPRILLQGLRKGRKHACRYVRYYDSNYKRGALGSKFKASLLQRPALFGGDEPSGF
jgi:hypothetical protein